VSSYPKIYQRDLFKVSRDQTLIYDKVDIVDLETPEDIDAVLAARGFKKDE